MEHIEQHRSFLELVVRTDNKQVRALLATITPAQLNIVSELCVNLLAGNVPITNKGSLKKYRKILRRLASKQTAKTKKALIKRWPQAVLVLIKATLPYLFRDEKDGVDCRREIPAVAELGDDEYTSF